MAKAALLTPFPAQSNIHTLSPVLASLKSHVYLVYAL